MYMYHCNYVQEQLMVERLAKKQMTKDIIIMNPISVTIKVYFGKLMNRM